MNIPVCNQTDGGCAFRKSSHGNPAETGATPRRPLPGFKHVPVQFAPLKTAVIGRLNDVALPAFMSLQPMFDPVHIVTNQRVHRSNQETGLALHTAAKKSKFNGGVRRGMALEILNAFDQGPEWPAVRHALDHEQLTFRNDPVKITGLGNAGELKHGLPTRWDARGHFGAVGVADRHGQESLLHTEARAEGLPFGRTILSARPEDMPQNLPSPWYETWFDSPHYHRLYGHRSRSEATAFVSKLDHHFGWSNLHLLDLACGQGRHAAAAATLGHRVVGMDLSANSIDHARKTYAGQERLTFVEGNMLDFELDRQFDGVLNLFTSFGYFDRREDHLAVLEGIRRHLKPGGFLILDYLNVDFSRARLVPEETIEREGVQYAITRSFGDLGHGVQGFIKTIEFEEEGRVRRFIERVSGMDLSELTLLLKECGLMVRQTFGDYDLSASTPGDSPRLILYAHAS